MGDAEVRKRADSGNEPVLKAPRQSGISRQVITAHIMSLMQRGFTRLLRRQIMNFNLRTTTPSGF